MGENLKNKKHMKIVYIDMDNVLVDFRSAFPKVDPELLRKFENDKDEIPGIFSLMEPMHGAIESVTFLALSSSVLLSLGSR